ncbi:shikimate kinase [Hippea jasoniae]|uniref:shikimate kinase n=1 Tax=Hippea jasoniae TaxID=944479 RepID=UPI000553C3E6|nr:shikimate kinase [Hippea jasoniae]
MNVVLVGFMGAGKTTIARILAKKKNLRFVDTDKLIEKETGLTIKEIFKIKGEDYFRDLERQIIDRYLLFCNNCVIATGGGMPCFFNNMEKLKKIGFVIYVNVDFDRIVKRVGDSNRRPLFSNLSEAKRLFNERIKCYHKADFVVDGNKEKEEVVQTIEKLVW